LKVECPSIREPVFLDIAMYEKIVLNLISNAYNFTLNGCISVRLQALGMQGVQLSIEDTGIGNVAAGVTYN
jgi:signal transduction histidine kinase